MTLLDLMSLTAGGAWPIWGFLIGRQWGTLSILLGLLAGSLIGYGFFWVTLRVGHWLIWRPVLDHPCTPFRVALGWLLLLATIAWLVISNVLAMTITAGLFTLFQPAPGRAAWEVAISAGVVYLARHPVLAIFVALINFAMVVLLSYLIFDRLLWIQFSEARSDWERQGCMSGYFWSPPGSRETSRHERGNLFNNWLTDPPYWVKARASFWRLLAWANFLALLPAVFVLLFSAPAAVLSLIGLR